VQRAAAEGQPFEILYLDWKMPQMDGIETARRIQALDLQRAPVVVMVTAYDRQEMLRESASIGAVDVLFKPVSPPGLMRITMAALQSHESIAGDKQTPADDVRTRLAAIQGARILLVEDNDINQIVAHEILTDAGFEVELADNGRAALEMVESRDYDIVLMDMQMPVMDGLAATAAIRMIDRFADLPIIALTANAMQSDREKCLAAGMNGHVSKPLEPEELWSALLRWTRRPLSTKHSMC
jgi:two-component system sensor histidine kinase/response regulator